MRALIAASSSSDSGTPGLARDRQQMQEAVGRAAGGHRAGHRVLEPAAVEEAPGARPLPGELHRERPGARRGGVLLLAVGGGDHAVAETPSPSMSTTIAIVFAVKFPAQ